MASMHVSYTFSEGFPGPHNQVRSQEQELVLEMQKLKSDLVETRTWGLLLPSLSDSLGAGGRCAGLTDPFELSEVALLLLSSVEGGLLGPGGRSNLSSDLRTSEVDCRPGAGDGGPAGGRSEPRLRPGLLLPAGCASRDSVLL